MSPRSMIVRPLPAALSIAAASFATSLVAAQESAPASQAAATQSQPASTRPIETASDVTPALPQAWLNTVAWRSIGPANMGGRITAICVSEQDPSLWYIATASGGLLKSINAGMTFEHLFDHEATVSIGDVACAPSDHNIVWIGTGEANPRNSASWGDGVYKSTDAGKTWKNMGLKDSHHTGQIAIHPTDPNIVYVGALGRLWGPNGARGLYKTTNGGAKWERILNVDDLTGVIDVKLQPGSPDVVLCATYERQRDGHDGNDPAKKIGPGAAIHRSTDGGKTWNKITAGLPSGKLGRIGLEWYRKDPNIVYAIVEAEKIAQEPENAPYAGFVSEDADVGARITRIEDNSPAAKAGLKVGDILVRMSDVTVHSAEEATAATRKHLAGDTTKVEISRERKTVTMDMTFEKRPGAEEDQAAATQPGAATRPAGAASRPADESETGGGGGGGGEGEQQSERQAERAREQARTPFSSGLGGQRENIHEQQGPDGQEFGGLYMSSDAGVSWKRINSVNPRPMYYSEIRVDPSDNKFIWVLGTSLYLSEDGGATFKAGLEGEAHVDHHAMWIDPRDGRHVVLGNDGGLYESHDRAANWDHHNHMAIGQFYHVSIDPRRDGRVYGGLQDNGTWGGPMRVRDNPGPINEDWISISGGDGFLSWVDPTDPEVVFSASQNGAVGWRNLKTGQSGSLRPRGERNIRLRWNWETPYVLSAHNPRIVYVAGNYVFKSIDRGGTMQRISPEITTAEQGTGTALSESPRDAGVLYVGTDDGHLWATRDGGQNWSDVYAGTSGSTTQGSASAPGSTQPAGGGGGRRGTGGGAGRGPGAGGGGGPPGAGGGGGGGGAPGGGGGRQQFDPARIAEQLKEVDANSDGKIQRDEMPRRMVAVFGRFDTNSDGVIDADEIAAITAGANQTPPATRPSEVEDIRVQPTPPASQPAATQPATQPAAEAAPATQPQPAAADDPITGSWEGTVDDPEFRSTFTFTLQLAADGKVTGRMTTQFVEGDLTGRFNRESKRLEMTMASDQVNVEYTGTVSARGIAGHVSVGEGRFEYDFEATRTSAVSATQEAPVRVEGQAAPRGRGQRGQAAPGGQRPPGAGGPGGGAGGGGGGGGGRTPDGKALKDLLPGPRWVSSIEASRYAPSRVYATFDGHRSDDVEPYVMVSEDYGQTWRSIRANLPTSAGSTKCVREDIVNQNLLYLGCEFSAWVSIDRGESWTKIANLPTVAVHDFAQHPTSGEIVAATHGRSLWAADISPLRAFTSEGLEQRAILCRPPEAIYWRREASRAGTLRRFEGQNPPAGASVYYAINRPAQRVRLQIVDPITGESLREVDGAREPGLYKVDWDLRRPPPPVPPAAAGGAGARGGAAGPGGGGGGGGRGGGGGGGGGGFRGGRGAGLVPAGLYRVVLTVDDQTFSQALTITTDPEYPDYRPWETEEMEEELRQLYEEDEEHGGGDEDEEVVN